MFFIFSDGLLLLHFVIFLFFSSSFSRIPFIFVSMIHTPLVSTISVINSYVDDEVFPIQVEARVLFPDHVLLLVKKRTQIYEDVYCCYHQSSRIILLPVLSVDIYDDLRWIARCPLPPYNHTATVDLQKGGSSGRGRKITRRSIASTKNGDQNSAFSWNSLVYAAYLDVDSVVVFVKGLNLKPDRKHPDPSQFSCHFRSQVSQNYIHTTNSVALAAAQEVIRCDLPQIIRRHVQKNEEISVSISSTSPRGPRRILPSVAMILPEEIHEKSTKKYEICICTMLWNQASHLHEWIIYHTFLGIDRWFIYDNNSEDNIKTIISNLQSQGFKVSRHLWPWLKTQEAGFSHCLLRSKQHCDWVGFLDVDEFFHLTHELSTTKTQRINGENSLKKMISNISSSGKRVGEIRTSCHSFGPSGLRSPPSHGVIHGYTCRLLNPERHKSIVRPEAVDHTLMNVVHHFKLKDGFRYVNMGVSSAVINHYKYQVWEVFKAKFSRRVATYVVDWQRDENQGSKDRAPGLGKEAIEPSDWALQFCQVWDTGLRDFVTLLLGDPATGLFPWMIGLN